jgi:hypothetical protein
MTFTIPKKPNCFCVEGALVFSYGALIIKGLFKGIIVFFMFLSTIK